MTTESVPHDLLDQLAESFLDRYRRGERPPISEYVARYPELANELQEVLSALVLMEQVDQDVQSPTGLRDETDNSAPLTQLGDFRIIREVGRGGMGVVYEAEQVSLGRTGGAEGPPPASANE